MARTSRVILHFSYLLILFFVNHFYSILSSIRGLTWRYWAGSFMMWLGFQWTQAQPLKLNFKHLTVADGLSQSTVADMLQDQKGFMWFGTWNGLNKYDGYTFTVYQNQPNDTTSISGNRIMDLLEDRDGNLWVATGEAGLNLMDRKQDRFFRFQSDGGQSHNLSSNSTTSLCEDAEGNLWIGTKGGLNRLDRKTRTISQYRHRPEDPHSLIDDDVNHVYEDSKGNLWIGTDSGGLDLFDRKNNRFIHYQHDPNKSNSLSHPDVREIFEDSQGQLWIGTGRGLNRLDRTNQTFVRYLHDPADARTIAHNVVLSLNEDPQGRLWIGTENGGLDVFDARLQQFRHFVPDANEARSINSLSIYSIYQDRHQHMWIGTFNGGINWVDRYEKKFRSYRHLQGDSNSLSLKFVNAFAQDRKGYVWIGTDGGGLNRFDPVQETFVWYRHERDNANSLIGDFMIGLHIDREDNIWAGSWEAGVTRINPDRTVFKRYQHDPNDPYSLSSNNPDAFTAGSQGNVWIGTYGGGFNLYNKSNDRFVRFLHNPSDSNSVASNYMRVLLQDRRGKLWVGLLGVGLDLYDPEKNTFTHFSSQKDVPGSISNNDIYSLFEDREGQLWIGTGGGLNRYDSGRFIVYSQPGLPKEAIMDMRQDDQGNLWIASRKGLCRFNPKTQVIRNYTYEDGLQGNEFNEASLKSRNGELYFGGTNGFTVFHPDSIRDNPFIPPVYLTNFQLFNQSIYPLGRDSLLRQTIEETREITLSYRQSVFSFEFAALNYSVPQKNQYAYRLEGFDKDWNYVGNKRQATYTNLDPGTYTFRVKASNNDGIWNEEGTSIKVTIVPPWWQTWWFRIGVALAAISLALSWYHLETYRIRRRNRELEVKVLERTNEIEQQKQEIASQRDNLNQLNEEISRKNEELERKVDERTQQLQAANEELNVSFEDLTDIHRKLITSADDLKESLHEKEVLLAEVHHRVKNNLAVVSGLLQMQLFTSDNPEVHAILQDSQNRIKSMALIHEKLYQNGTFASIDFSDYISKLVAEIQYSYPNQAQSVQVHLDLEPITLELTVAIPCGLLLNELLSNAYKHAFKGRETGRIDVVFKQQENGHCLLKVSDNGVGLSAAADLHKSTSMGVKLIHTLAKQLHGQMEFCHQGGLTFSLKFEPVKMKTWNERH